MKNQEPGDLSRMSDIKQPARGERVTIRTVAADAGVSVAAVSKVLRNAYGVSETLRQNVMASIERLSYRPSVAARGMRGQTYTIGILLVEIANPFLPEVVDGVDKVLSVAGYKALLGIGDSNMPLEASLIESMIDNRMDGLILVAPRMSGETLDHFARQIPMVVIGHHESTATGFDTINSDDSAGAAMAVHAFVERGHRDIMMVNLDNGGEQHTSVGHRREVGYYEAMAKAGLSDRARVFYVPQGPEWRDARFYDLLTAPDRPSAIFCWSDLDAIQLVNQARGMGLDLPGDLAIIGYDNSRVAALPLINLASMDQDGRKLGSMAAEALLTRISGRRKAEHPLLLPTLVARASL
jgi:LacI family transcriptional regulator